MLRKLTLAASFSLAALPGVAPASDLFWHIQAPQAAAADDVQRPVAIPAQQAAYEQSEGHGTRPASSAARFAHYQPRAQEQPQRGPVDEAVPQRRAPAPRNYVEPEQPRGYADAPPTGRRTVAPDATIAPEREYVGTLAEGHVDGGYHEGIIDGAMGDYMGDEGCQFDGGYGGEGYHGADGYCDDDGHVVSDRPLRGLRLAVWRLFHPGTWFRRYCHDDSCHHGPFGWFRRWRHCHCEHDCTCDFECGGGYCSPGYSSCVIDDGCGMIADGGCGMMGGGCSSTSMGDDFTSGGTIVSPGYSAGYDHGAMQTEELPPQRVQPRRSARPRVEPEDVDAPGAEDQSGAWPSLIDAQPAGSRYDRRSPEGPVERGARYRVPAARLGVPYEQGREAAPRRLPLGDDVL